MFHAPKKIIYIKMLYPKCNYRILSYCRILRQPQIIKVLKIYSSLNYDFINTIE